MGAEFEKMSSEELREFRLATAAAIARLENENSHDSVMNQVLVRMLQADDLLETLEAEVKQNPDAAERLLHHAIHFLGYHRVLYRADKEAKRRAAPNN